MTCVWGGVFTSPVLPAAQPPKHWRGRGSDTLPTGCCFNSYFQTAVGSKELLWACPLG